MIAVLFALPAESSAFVGMLATPRREKNLVCGQLGDAPIVLLHTGVGAAVCRERLNAFLANATSPLLLSSGFGGATSDWLEVGDLLIAENFSDETLREAAQQLLPAAKVGRLYSAENVIDAAADRYRIGREHGAAAIDLETATIARIAGARGIPMLSLRVISDSPAHPFPAPPDVLFDVPAQRTQPLRLLAYVARNPGAGFRVIKFSAQVNRAKMALAEALRTLIPRLSKQFVTR